MKNVFSNKRLYKFRPSSKSGVFLLLLGLVFLEAGVLIFTKPASSTGSASIVRMASLQEHADAILEKCALSDYRRTCYEEEIPKVMNVASMEDAFEVTRLVTENDRDFLRCHTLGHSLASKEVAKDPLNWKDVLARCPTATCNNGCLHGALMERFKNRSEFLSNEQIEKIKPDLSETCEPRDGWRPTELTRSMCYHGLGHLNMYMTNADINKSLEICKEIGVKDDGRSYVQTCFEGVFMQIFQPLEPEDFALVEGITPTKEEVASFCGDFSEMALNACRKESHPLFRKEIMQPEGLTRFCSYTENGSAQRHCYGSIMNVIVPVYVVDGESLDRFKAFCKSLPTDVVGLCFAHAARRLVQIDSSYTQRAIEVCTSAETAGVGEECYEMMAYYAKTKFLPESEELSQYCNKLPEAWNGKCLRGFSLPGNSRLR